MTVGSLVELTGLSNPFLPPEVLSKIFCYEKYRKYRKFKNLVVSFSNLPDSKQLFISWNINSLILQFTGQPKLLYFHFWKTSPAFWN